MAGTALGMLILPQLVRMLLENYGFFGAMLVLSGISLHAALGSTLLQPVRKHLIEVPIDIEMAPCINGNDEKLAKENGNPDVEDNFEENKNFLFVPNQKKMRKNHSELAMSTMTSRMAKRPSFALERKTSSAVLRRRASVISSLSQLDFTGSTVQVHMNVS